MATRYEEMRDWTLAVEPTSYWLRDAVEALDRRDPADALMDARALACLCKIRCDEVVAQNPTYNTRRW